MSAARCAVGSARRWDLVGPAEKRPPADPSLVPSLPSSAMPSSMSSLMNVALQMLCTGIFIVAPRAPAYRIVNARYICTRDSSAVYFVRVGDRGPGDDLSFV
ncbi:hypothetical protein MRX96_059341 [Rhipicephalus microplus]